MQGEARRAGFDSRAERLAEKDCHHLQIRAGNSYMHYHNGLNQHRAQRQVGRREEERENR